MYIEKVEHDKANALIFVRNILSLLIYSITILTILMLIFMPWFTKMMFPGFFADADKFELLVILSRITIFYLLFISIVSLFSGVLNSLGKFAVTSSSSIILNVTLILSLYLIAPFVPNYAYALSWGVFVAGLLQLLWVSYFLFKAKILVYPTIPAFNSDTKKFFRKLLPGVIGANVMQINLFVDTIIASLIPGAVSCLYYADHVNQLPLAMIGIAIGVALLPALSRKIKSGDEKGATQLQNIALEISLILAIPAALALTCISYPIISVLFERGAFTAENTAAVSLALKFYSIGLPAYIIVKVLEPSFFSRGNTKTPMKIAITCLISNVILNLLFFKPFGYIGIILASVISSYLNVSLLLWNLIKEKHFYFEKDFAIKIIQIIIPALLMAFILVVLKNYFDHSENLGKASELTIIISSGLLIYLGAIYVSGALNIVLKNLKPKKK
jgi:putative peptidoglycan lipid II flippase